ncbi:MAG TPA: NAD(P)/FAD-dependent oxidoreductase [Polyangiaceae bacterium LLY-WYZ-14_1]|nr:NAD(P)/FAD-dependent oxidoreductase [Polyangiaceae bacterium LLY-WYZ-14_1]
MPERWDAIVVGAGPNGLSAANALVDAGKSVLLLEARERAGGAARTEELTEAGFHHDTCSAIHPMGMVSPAFRSFDLEAHGLRWVHPDLPVAQPLDGGEGVALRVSVDETAEALGSDARAYRRLMGPLARRWEELFDEALRPLLRIPGRPLLMARFALRALRTATGLARGWFDGEPARALFAGSAAHSVLDLDAPGTAAFGIMLNLAGHGVGWPFPQGGAGRIADALVARFEAKGGTLRTGVEVGRLAELPDSRVVLFDVVPSHLARIAGEALPPGYRRRLERFRHGFGTYKLDWALDGPIPWRSELCRRAGTVHVGGTLDEVAASEKAVSEGRLSDHPFLILAQQSLFDPTRAPEGKHTGWAYCHVPNGFDGDATELIEAQVERFAPGFRDRILARHVAPPAWLESLNANLVGGDVGGGRNDLWQLLARPAFRLDPYATPNPRLFLCSAATPPGGGVHGMGGWWAARSALRRRF